jgi:hypothetical protein
VGDGSGARRPGLAVPPNHIVQEELLMSVTARFYVAEMTHRSYDPDAAEITLKPAYNNGSGNEAWAKATPSGEMKLQVQNHPAVQFFAEAMRDRRDLHITFDYVAAEDEAPAA